MIKRTLMMTSIMLAGSWLAMTVHGATYLTWFGTHYAWYMQKAKAGPNMSPQSHQYNSPSYPTPDEIELFLKQFEALRKSLPPDDPFYLFPFPIPPEATPDNPVGFNMPASHRI